MRRSKFSLSHYKLFTGEMGLLLPISWYEALPGDSIQHSTSALVRLSPLMAPVMHPVRIRIHHWFVPNRLLWEDWEDFITGGPDGDFSVEFPHFSVDTNLKGSLHDYLGIPVQSWDEDMQISALPARAYHLIYNEWYRDQDLIEETAISTESGVDTTTDHNLIHHVAWEKDFFTTARPWEQKGEEVVIPIGQRADIVGLGKVGQFYGLEDQEVYESGQSGTRQHASGSGIDWAEGNRQFSVEEDPQNPGFPNLYADLSDVTGVSVNELRLALAIQRYKEARAQYGSRYVEYLRYLGVRSSDARLQNPEFLGGGRQVIQFSEVLQTGPDPQGGEESYVGDMKGHGIAAMRSNRFRRFFEEHGIVMTMMSVIPKSIYSSGIARPWSRMTKEDYFQKELQYIGEQAIYNKEVCALDENPEEVFGYQTRYDEYRWLQSDVAGEFDSAEMNHWHLARRFYGDVALNQSFIDCVPDKRIHASQLNDSLLVMANHSVQARRMLAKYPRARTF